MPANSFNNFIWEVPLTDGAKDQVFLSLSLFSGRETVSLNGKVVSDRRVFRLKSEHRLTLSDGREATLSIKANFRRMGFPDCTLQIGGEMVPSTNHSAARQIALRRSPWMGLLGGVIGVLSFQLMPLLYRHVTARTPVSKVLLHAENLFHDYPDLMKQLRRLTKADAHALARRLSFLGLKRLSNEDLLQRARMLNSILAVSDEQTCASIVKGNVNEAGYVAAVNRLPEQEVQALFQLSLKAADLELKKAEYPFVGPAELSTALRKLSGLLTREDSKRFNAVLNSLRTKPTTSDTDVCWLGKTLFATLPRAEKSLASTVARGLVEN